MKKQIKYNTELNIEYILKNNKIIFWKAIDNAGKEVLILDKGYSEEIETYILKKKENLV